MSLRNLVRRLKQVETTLAPPKNHRWVVRFEGPGSEHLPKPTEEEIRDHQVLVVQFVAARDGRPA